MSLNYAVDSRLEYFDQEYVGFILSINEAVQGKKTSSLKPFNDRIAKVVTLLDSLDRLIDETPPTDQPQRFGNKSFRTWFQKIQDVRYFLLILFISFINFP